MVKLRRNDPAADLSFSLWTAVIQSNHIKHIYQHFLTEAIKFDFVTISACRCRPERTLCFLTQLLVLAWPLAIKHLNVSSSPCISSLSRTERRASLRIYYGETTGRKVGWEKWTEMQRSEPRVSLHQYLYTLHLRSEFHMERQPAVSNNVLPSSIHTDVN